MGGQESFFHWCARGRHSVCPHLPMTIDPGSQPPRIVIRTTSPSLCPCPCHEDCPINARSGEGWPESCTCPGAHSEEWSEFGRPDFLDIARKSFAKNGRRQAAKRELRKRVRGLDAEEAENLFDVIWAEHDLAPPIPALRRVLAERAMGTRSRTEDLAVSANILRGAGKWISNIAGMINGDTDKNPFGSGSNIRIPSGEGHVQVLLDPDVQPRLTAMSDKSMFVTRVATSVFVALRLGENDELEVWELQSTLSEKPVRLGHLSPEDGAPYRPYVAPAGRVGHDATCHGLRGDGPEGSWSLLLWLPDDRRT